MKKIFLLQILWLSILIVGCAKVEISNSFLGCEIGDDYQSAYDTLSSQFSDIIEKNSRLNDKYNVKCIDISNAKFAGEEFTTITFVFVEEKLSQVIFYSQGEKEQKTKFDILKSKLDAKYEKLRISNGDNTASYSDGKNVVEINRFEYGAVQSVGLCYTTYEIAKERMEVSDEL